MSETPAPGGSPQTTPDIPAPDETAGARPRLPPPADEPEATDGDEIADATDDSDAPPERTDAGTAPTTGGDGRPADRATIRAGAVVAVALAAAFVTWLLVRGSDDAETASVTTVVTVTAPATTAATEPATTRPAATSKPKTVTEAELAALAAGRTVYWAEPASGGRTITFSEGQNGAAYVRYLPAGVTTADEIPPSLVIATYPMEGAFAAVRRSGKATGSVTTPLDGGGLAVYATARPTNVYFSYPKSPVQVEVYDPTPGRALELVRSGIVRPIAP